MCSKIIISRDILVPNIIMLTYGIEKRSAFE